MWKLMNRLFDWQYLTEYYGFTWHVRRVLSLNGRFFYKRYDKIVPISELKAYRWEPLTFDKDMLKGEVPMCEYCDVAIAATELRSALEELLSVKVVEADVTYGIKCRNAEQVLANTQKATKK